MKAWGSVLAALLVIGAGCGSGETDLLSERTGPLEISVTSLLDEVGTHASALMVAQEVDAARALEAHHVRYAENSLDHAVFWAGEIANCGIDTEAVDTYLADAAMELAEHRTVMFFAESVDAIHQEGWRYAGSMMGAANQLLDAVRALDADAGETTCPELTGEPPPYLIERPPLGENALAAPALELAR